MADMVQNGEATRLLLAELKEALPEGAYEQWFKDMEVLRLSERLLILCVKTEIAQDVILNRYPSVVKEAALKVGGNKVELMVYNTQYAPLDQGKVDADERDYLEKGIEPVNMAETEVPAATPAAGESGRSDTRGKFTFENFIVGKSNIHACTMCKVVAENLESPYNPLFLYGPSGIGKTHLLYATTNEIRRRHPGKRILYVTSEEYANQFVYALQRPSGMKRDRDGVSRTHIESFKDMYRSCDVLLVDDVQFFEGKELIFEEFFFAFNTLKDRGKQLIIASDRHPKEFNFEDRFITRFEESLIVDIQPPDLELRTAIFKNKAAELDINVPIEVLYFLAENITRNIRQIEGALKKLKAYSFFSNTPITVELARETIGDILSGVEPMNVKVDRIIKAVSEAYGVPVEDIKGTRKTAEIVNARFVAIYIIRRKTDLSYPSVGKIFNRDHSTIINANDKFTKELSQSPQLKAEVEGIIKTLGM